MNQTRVGSLIETGFNIVIGLAVSMVANYYVFPLYGFVPTVSVNAKITGIYTIISVVRQYVLRRWFNQMLHKASMKIAGKL